MASRWSGELPCGELNRHIAIKALAAFVLLLFSAGYSSAQNGWRYGNTPYHFSLEIPAGWKVTPASRKTLVAFAGIKVHNFAPNFNVTAVQVGNTSLADYTAATKKRYAKVQTDQKTKTQRDRVVKVTKLSVYDEVDMKLDGLPAHSWRMQINIPNQPGIEERQVFCIRAKRCLGLTFAARKEDAKQNDPLFDKMLASFRWDK